MLHSYSFGFILPNFGTHACCVMQFDTLPATVCMYIPDVAAASEYATTTYLAHGAQRVINRRKLGGALATLPPKRYASLLARRAGIF